MQQAKLTDVFAELVPLMRDYLATKCFGGDIDLRKLLLSLSSLALRGRHYSTGLRSGGAWIPSSFISKVPTQEEPRRSCAFSVEC